LTKYNQTTEHLMLLHYSDLTEPQKRQYAYVESQKLGWGGKTYICNLLNITQKTIRKGEKELKTPSYKEEIPLNRQRRKGGGRKKF
jgi:hypothetical protein